MKNVIKLFFAMGLFLISVQAHALVLTPSDCNVGVNCWTSDENANLDASEVAALIGYTDPLAEIYKQNVGEAFDTGSFAASYSTTFSNSATDPEDALIEYVSGNVISCPDCFVIVKDGNQSPNQYVFDIGFWNGLESISLEDFFPQQGAISHIALYSGRSATVPEPGMVALLAIGLLGVVAARRKKTV